MPPKSKAPPTAEPPRELAEKVRTGQINVAGHDHNRLVVQRDTARTSIVSADPRKEYIAGGSYSWTATYLKTLPFWIDDLTRDFGDDLYERMMIDPKVSQAVNFRKTSVLSDGLELGVPVKDSDPEYERASAIRDFCQANLDAVDPPFVGVFLWDMLDAIPLGNKVAEQVYWETGQEPDEGLVLKSLKVKPRRAVGYVLDVYSNVVGLLGMIPGQGAPVLVEGMIGYPDQVPNLLPRRKFAVLTHRMKDNDPRGTSGIRAAYDPWFQKLQAKQPHLKFLTQFGTPSLVGTTSENSQAMPVEDADGNVILDTNGNPVSVTPEQALASGLQAFQGGTYIVIPAGATVTVIESKGDGSAFAQAFQWFDDQISLAVLGETLASGEGVHQTRASSQVHQDSRGSIVRHDRLCTELMIYRDILKLMVEYHFGKQWVRLTPVPSLSKTEHQDFPDKAKAIAALATAAYLDPSQYPEIDNDLGLPTRDPEAIDRATRMLDAAVDQAENPPEPAAAGTNGNGNGK